MAVGNVFLLNPFTVQAGTQKKQYFSNSDLFSNAINISSCLPSSMLQTVAIPSSV